MALLTRRQLQQHLFFLPGTCIREGIGVELDLIVAHPKFFAESIVVTGVAFIGCDQ